MKGILNKKEPLLLFLGDMLVFAISLWFSLFVRFQNVPSTGIFLSHLIPFVILFLIWTLSFFIAGLYETHRIMIRNRLPEILFKTQIVNSIIAIVFFYFVTFFGVTPKTTLFIYVIISLLFIIAWRIFALVFFVSKKKTKAVLIGSGRDAEVLLSEVNKVPRFNFEFVLNIKPESLKGLDFKKEVIEKIYSEDIKIIVIDSTNDLVTSYLPHFYNLIFSGVQFIDFHKLSGEVFYRYPVNLLSHSWFIQNISIAKHSVYDFSKRIMDILVSIPSFVLSLPFLFLGMLLLKIQGGGSVFTIQNRVGQFGKNIKLLKLRTMLFNDDGAWGTEGKKNEVTKVGAFLRKTRIDELPQIINVLKGDISLIGPRPEFPQAVSEYAANIPYYNARHIIKPGLSGWAQIYHDAHPHHGIDIEETKNKLSYDLFYIKNRSLMLDVVIALKTIRTLVSREGR